MEFKVNDKVIFTWNFSQFPCIIEEIIINEDTTNCKTYKVRFPENSYAGSHENPRIILGYYLKLDPDYQNEIKTINTQRYEIEI
jgi:hypothetical protein